MKIIEDLYFGRISPYEMSISTTPEYQKLKTLSDRNEDLLRELLSDEQKELLEKLIETVTDISSISERDMFINGFRLGVKLMMDDCIRLFRKSVTYYQNGLILAVLAALGA